ncbi:MAG TPA: hypothetical protein DDY91_06955, partial [Planctomycetaceae bacterium]|nr:hypothetical protein [Planctomycetaceae bacterium]
MLQGTTGRDTLVVDLSQGNPLNRNEVTFLGGEGFDRIEFRGGSVETFRASLNPGVAGQLQFDAGKLQIETVEQIVSGLSVERQTIEWTGTTDMWVTGSGQAGEILLSTQLDSTPSLRLLAPREELVISDGPANRGVTHVHDLELNQVHFRLIGQAEDRLETFGTLRLDGTDIDWQMGQIQLGGRIEWNPGAADNLSVARSQAGLDLHADSRLEVLSTSQIIAPGGQLRASVAEYGELAVAGSINLSQADTGGHAGALSLTGGTILLDSSAHLEASGDRAGTLNIGGLPSTLASGETSARQVWISSGARLEANGHGLGSGGRVTVWSTDRTWFEGQISVQEGGVSAAGGFVEVSSQGVVAFRGSVDLGGKYGTAGTFLLDPRVITIIDQNEVATDLFEQTISETDLESLSGTIVLEADDAIILNDLVTDGVLSLSDGSHLVLRTRNQSSLPEAGIFFRNSSNRIAPVDGGRIDVTMLAGVSPEEAAAGISSGHDGRLDVGALSTSGGSLTLAAAELIQLRGRIETDLGSVTLVSASLLQSDTGAISARNLHATITAPSAAMLLENPDNAVQVIQIATIDGDVHFSNSRSLQISSLAAGTGTATLDVVGNVTQTGAIVAQELRVHALMAGADITLTNTDNRVGTLEASTIDGDIVFRNSQNLQITSLAAVTGTATLDVVGNVAQTGAIAAQELRVHALTTGSDITLTNTDNRIGTLAASTLDGDVDFRNNQDLQITSLAAGTGTATLDVVGSVTQSGAIVAQELRVHALKAGADISLTNTGNRVGTLAASTLGGDIDFRNNQHLQITSLAAGTGTATLDVVGSVTQTGAIAAQELRVHALSAGSGITLTNTDNRVGTLEASTIDGEVGFRNNQDLQITSLAAGASAATLDVVGNVTQTGAISAKELRVHALSAGSDITLTKTGNQVGTLEASTIDGDVAFRNSRNLQVASVQAGQGDVHLIVAGHVTQSGAIVGQHLRVETIAGSWFVDLQNTSNLVQTLSVSTDNADVHFRNSQNLLITLLAAGTGTATLDVVGNVTQTGAIVAQDLRVHALKTGARVSLTNTGNQVGTLAASTIDGDAGFRNNQDLLITLLAAGTGTATLDVVGNVTQTGAIVAQDLQVHALKAGANVSLTNTGNQVGALAASTIDGDVGFRNNQDLLITSLAAGTSTATLDVVGSVTHSGAIVAQDLQVHALKAGASVSLTNTGNQVGTLAASTIDGDVGFRNSQDLLITSLAAGTGTATLDIVGNVTQTGAIVAQDLQVHALQAGASVSLTNTGNQVVTLAASTIDGDVGFRNSQDLLITSLAAGTGTATLAVVGNVTQTGAIVAQELRVHALAIGSHITLTDADNRVGTLAASTIDGDIDFRNSRNLQVASVQAGQGDVNLIVAGHVTQSGAIVSHHLRVATIAGSWFVDLQNTSNLVQTLSVSTDNADVHFRNNQDLQITSLAAGTGTATLDVVGNVTQSGSIAAQDLQV